MNPSLPKSISCLPALSTMYSSTYISIYALWLHSLYVTRVVFRSLKYSWQTAPYTSATIATISTKGMFSFSSFTSSWPLSPMASSQKFQHDPSLSTGENIERESVQQYYIQHVVVKTEIWGHHEGDKTSIYRRDGKSGQTNTTTIATWGHEPIISNGYEDIIRRSSSVYISERREMRASQDHNHWNMRTWTNHSKRFNAPVTSHPVYLH